ncbi:hypothetical protein LRS73_35230 (plasmid) [Methylobacterium currus]|uniref:hypothetical protein n=1 Tax=Methylobacterium currus TaxID=2051553 RepID=UPI001E2933F1|nr:hypothetical protein [Methylobacterium currus]UHC20429.1 hypothetical protein LRS73_35230 [Methylobacterium currus]
MSASARDNPIATRAALYAFMARHLTDEHGRRPHTLPRPAVGRPHHRLRGGTPVETLRNLRGRQRSVIPQPRSPAQRALEQFFRVCRQWRIACMMRVTPKGLAALGKLLPPVATAA